MEYTKLKYNMVQAGRCTGYVMKL